MSVFTDMLGCKIRSKSVPSINLDSLGPICKYLHKGQDLQDGVSKSLHRGGH